MYSEKIPVIYRDEHFIAVNKPAGLLIHPTMIDRHEKRNLVSILEEQCGRKVYVIHRLDKPTSGAVLLAFDSSSASKAVNAFSQKEVKKTYLAVVRGYPPVHDVIDSPVSDVQDKLLIKQGKGKNRLREAVTEYRRLQKTELPVSISKYPSSRYSLLEVHPKTGRMHQIRKHLKKIRYPIIGDTKYGDHRHNRHFREHMACDRMLLAATELTFFHPNLERMIKIEAQIGGEFLSIIKQFEWTKAIPKKWLGRES